MTKATELAVDTAKGVALAATTAARVYGGLLKAGFNVLKSKVVDAATTIPEEELAKAEEAYEAVKASYRASNNIDEQDTLMVKMIAAHNHLLAALETPPTKDTDMYYDEELFEKFRALAVTGPLQLVPGKTYYSNAYHFLPEFTVVRLVTQAEHERLMGREVRGNDSKLAWVVCEGTSEHVSLADRNFYGSYNPWLVFESKELRDACKAMLKIEYDHAPVSVPPKHQAYSYRGFFVKAHKNVVKVANNTGNVVKWIDGAEGESLKAAFDWVDKQLYKPERLCDLDLKPGDKLVYQNTATGNKYPYVVPEDVKGFILSCSPLPCWTKE